MNGKRITQEREKEVKLSKKKVISNKWRITNPGKRGSKSR